MGLHAPWTCLEGEGLFSVRNMKCLWEVLNPVFRCFPEPIWLVTHVCEVQLVYKGALLGVFRNALPIQSYSSTHASPANCTRHSSVPQAAVAVIVNQSCQ